MVRLTVVLYAISHSCCVARAESFDRSATLVDASASFQSEVLLSDLDNPAGIVLRPVQPKAGPFELIVAESGAGRIVRISTRDPKKRDEVIVDFPVVELAQQPPYRVGPLALGFLTRTKLAVTVAGGVGDAEAIACYRIRPDGPVLTADQQDHVVQALDPSRNPESGDLTYCGLALDGKRCFATSFGQGTGGSILRCTVEANRLGNLQPFFDTQAGSSLSAPGGIAVIPEPRPAFLVAGLMGSRDTPRDSRLVFLVPSEGDVALNLPTGLSDIIALAYSPSGQLYAADFSWHNEKAGGIYRLDDARIDGRQTCRPVKIATVVRPYALAFAPDGTLFVTAFGPGENEQKGQLLKITGEL